MNYKDRRKVLLTVSLCSSAFVYLFGLYVTFEFDWVLDYLNFNNPEERLKTLFRACCKTGLDILIGSVIIDQKEIKRKRNER